MSRALSQASYSQPVHMVTDTEVHAHVLEEALKHSQDELDCAKRNRVALDVRILGQAAEIRRLQQSLATAQEQVVNVHSMCNTAYCNHVRAIVGRIEQALLPAQSLVEMLQPLQGAQVQSTGSERVDIDLKACWSLRSGPRKTGKGWRMHLSIGSTGYMPS